MSRQRDTDVALGSPDPQVLSVVVFDKRAENKSYHVFKLLSFAFWVACGLVHANTKQLASLLDFSLVCDFHC